MKTTLHYIAIAVPEFVSCMLNGLKHQCYSDNGTDFMVGTSGWQFTVTDANEIVVSGNGRNQNFGRHYRTAINFINERS